jgi:hypothetical protein
VDLDCRYPAAAIIANEIIASATIFVVFGNILVINFILNLFATRG